MEESTLLPVIMAAIFLMIIIGIVVWVLMTKTVVSPAVIPIPLAPLRGRGIDVPPSGVPNPPSSVPQVTVSGTVSSVDTNEEARHILVFDHRLKEIDSMVLPEDDIVYLAFHSDELYCSSNRSIYVYSEEWELVGSVPNQDIVDLFSYGRHLIVRTHSEDYQLDRSRDQVRMITCDTIDRATPFSVDDACWDSNDNTLCYISGTVLNLTDDDREISQELNCSCYSIALSEDSVYLLVD